MPISVIFFGTPDFSVPTLRALCEDPRFWVKAIVTQPDRPAGRGSRLTASPVKLLAQQHHVPVLQPERIKKSLESFLETAREHGPYDIGVVIAFGQILPPSVLALPEAGCVNIHASLLPRWRGAAPLQRAIMAGDDSTGVSIMRMEEGLDTGPVFRSAKIPLTEETTLSSLHDELALLGARELVHALPSIAKGTVIPTPQPEDGVTYAAKVTNEEAAVDWNRDARELSCHVRGLSPAPGAFTFYKSQRIKILNARAKDAVQSASPASPGQIVRLRDEGVEVACRRDWLLITELQLEGKKRMSAKDFLLGNRISEGERLEMTHQSA